MKVRRGNPVAFRSVILEILSEFELRELHQFLAKFKHEKPDAVAKLFEKIDEAVHSPDSHVELTDESKSRRK